MAGNKHPWRDVMSFNAWQQVLIRTKTAPPSAQDHLGKIGQQLSFITHWKSEIGPFLQPVSRH